MGKTAEDIIGPDGLSDETVIAAVYVSVLGAAKAGAWRDRLERAGCNDLAGVATGSSTDEIVDTAFDGGAQPITELRLASGKPGLWSEISPQDATDRQALITRHFGRALYLRSRLVAAQNHGCWPDLQDVLPCSAADWLLTAREGDILAAGGNWPASGRVTDSWISERLALDATALPQWRDLFSPTVLRPALALLRQDDGSLLMCQSLGGRAGLSGYCSTFIDSDQGNEVTGGSAALPPAHTGDPTTPAFLIERLQTAWSDPAACRVARRFGFEQDEMSLLRGLLTGDGWVELRLGTGGQRGPELAVLGRMVVKTCAPSCPEMLRFLAYLMKQTVRDTEIATGADLPLQHKLDLPSGLRSRYLCFGAEQGRPVIFVHGIFDGVAGVQRLQHRLRARGLRLFAPLRFGYGASDRLPREADPIDLFVTQLEALMDAEGLDAPILLGHRSGCLFAAVAARRLRDRLGGVICVGATLPLSGVGHAAALRGHQRAMALSAVHASAVLPLVVRSWSRSVRQKGPQVLVSRQIARDSADRRLLADPALSAVLNQSHAMMMQQGRGGYETDLRLAVRARDMRYSANSAPTIYLHGGEDKVTPPDKLQAAIGSGANLQVRVSKRAGTMLLYSQPELVFAAIDDLRQGRT
ncbi:alpha/beta fold hydrolase [Phaeobacter porticola]|uniref:Putative hydrolase or acyltransferase (Alpha/beta hydrolase superfamily) n=1 Tax=Phaeobacter porticola TaxID=1844006 RepID=A0A1L3I7G2_9RHOB|nr:alpha/beta hydrolase [Phaeobacter porticola]APG48055.1 putative hydrolase or acyltransferase (alpha/beta hydrolase superfamily) [Phaeobacter porticola]